VLASLGALASPAVAAAPAPLRFEVRYDGSITDSFSGRVYVLCSTSPRPEPRFGPRWFGDDPFFAVDVAGWRPGDPLVVGEEALAFPAPTSEVPPDTYRVQALMRRNTDAHALGSAPGNAYSASGRMELDGATSGAIDLLIDRVVEARTWEAYSTGATSSCAPPSSCPRITGPAPGSVIRRSTGSAGSAATTASPRA
jgi:hypothetical protein